MRMWFHVPKSDPSTALAPAAWVVPGRHDCVILSMVAASLIIARHPYDFHDVRRTLSDSRCQELSHC